jgi:serine/threonine protein phosphatase 1
MTLEFHPEVAQEHHRLDLAEWENAYVVGDVHGCADALDRLCSVLDVSEDDLVVFVGDLIRKGPDSSQVVERVRTAENMFSIRGNNEEKVLRGEKTVESLDDGDIEWLRSLPVAISWDGGLVVHGGVDPRRPLAEHTIDDLQTTRSLAPEGGYDGPFWHERYEGPPRVFFGHTVLEEPLVTDWAIGLDTGCVYGGTLSAYDLRHERIHDVPASQPGRSRSDSKIVSTATLAGSNE